jgi:hypothetical protein
MIDMTVDLVGNYLDPRHAQTHPPAAYSGVGSNHFMKEGQPHSNLEVPKSDATSQGLLPPFEALGTEWLTTKEAVKRLGQGKGKISEGTLDHYAKDKLFQEKDDDGLFGLVRDFRYRLVKDVPYWWVDPQTKSPRWNSKRIPDGRP